MKYLKKNNENIDWDNWDWEEENIELTDYVIEFHDIYQCIDIAKKLKKLKYGVYNYNKILREQYNHWKRFSYDHDSKIWTRNRVLKNYKKILTYDEFMNL